MAKNSSATQIYAIKITLQDVKPTIWRRLHVASDINLAQLHQVIQIAMGWTDSHLHEFVISGERYGSMAMNDELDQEIVDESQIRLDKVAAPKSRFIYEYDFGDDWRHEIKIEKIVDAKVGIKTPYCVGGELACPPEDCGGAWGYVDMLEKLAEPANEERSELIEWLGYEFDPQQFDLHEINENLQHLQK
ncbi:plasmid pRiA4b ORF-3 family protein [Glaciimonas sp. GG7]